MTIFVLEKNGDLNIYSSILKQRELWNLIESGEYLRAFDELGHVFSIGTLGTEGDRFVIYPMPGILKSTKIYRSKWFIGAI